MRYLLALLLLSLPLTSAAQEPVVVLESGKETGAPLTAHQLRDHLRTHLDLDNHGLKYQWKLKRSKPSPPLKFEVEGPVHRGLGLKFTVRF